MPGCESESPQMGVKLIKHSIRFDGMVVSAGFALANYWQAYQARDEPRAGTQHSPINLLHLAANREQCWL